MGSFCGGGGIYNDDGVLTVNQSTLIGNHADYGATGGGIFNYFYLTNGLVTIINSIVAGNSGSTADIFNLDQIASLSLNFIGANIVQDNSGSFIGSAPISADPQLAPLGDYGGPTQTMPPLPGSPAIDACNTSTFTTDQRGFPRILNGFPDLGAVEGTFNPAGPGQLTGLTRLGNDSIQFTFTNLVDASFTVLASTNVALPITLWSNLGHALESPINSGNFQFTDPQATNYPQRFYRVQTP